MKKVKKWSREMIEYLRRPGALPGTPPKIIKNTFLGGPNVHTYKLILIFSIQGGSEEANDRFIKNERFFDECLRIAELNIL